METDNTFYMGLKGKILRKWDWWIYRHALKTMRRMAIDNPGWSYLFELEIRVWNAEHPIDPSLKSATEHFHRSLEEH